MADAPAALNEVRRGDFVERAKTGETKMTIFIPGEVTPKKRRAAMQAALYRARENRIARVVAAETPSVPTSVQWKCAGTNQFAQAHTDGSGYWSNSSFAPSLATKYIFSIVDKNGVSVSAFLDTFVAGSGSPHKTKVTLTSAGATFVFYVNSDDTTANGYRSFNTSPFSAAGAINFNDVFTATVGPPS